MQRTLFGLIVLVSLVESLVADETVENLEYKKWTVWKVGAFATLKGENDFGGMVTIVTTTHSLKQISADKIIIEVTTMTEANGQKIKAPPTTYAIPAREPKLSDEVRKQLEEQSKTIASKQTKGKETLTINGKKLDCDWVRYQSKGNDSKGWTSDQVPGETVKTTSANGPLKSSLQLIDWNGEKK